MSGWDIGSTRKRSLLARMPCRINEIFLDKNAAFAISFEWDSSFIFFVESSIFSSSKDKNPLADGSSWSTAGGAVTITLPQFEVLEFKSRPSVSVEGWESSIGGRAVICLKVLSEGGAIGVGDARHCVILLGNLSGDRRDYLYVVMGVYRA